MGFGGGENVLGLESDMGCTILWIYKRQWIAHFKRVNLMICHIYYNKVVDKNYVFQFFELINP